MTSLQPSLFSEAFRCLPMGVFILDQNKKICAWNDWMAEKTGISFEQAVSKTFSELFSKVDHARFLWAIDQVMEFSSPQILSQLLNHYLIPILLERSYREDFDKMQQHVEIYPIFLQEEKYALVCIQDVTDSVRLKTTLMEMGHELENQSLHDALTNIYNRRFLWEWLENQIEQAKRNHFSIGCCLYDIDHFKEINDRYGHKQGDYVLKTFVNLALKVLRKEDIFVRYGGEEFVSLLPRAKLADVKNQAERVLMLVREHPVFPNENTHVTCSAGVAVWNPEYPMEAKELIELADKALYQAKESGRNRVCVMSSDHK